MYLHFMTFQSNFTSSSCSVAIRCSSTYSFADPSMFFLPYTFILLCQYSSTRDWLIGWFMKRSKALLLACLHAPRSFYGSSVELSTICCVEFLHAGTSPSMWNSLNTSRCIQTDTFGWAKNLCQRVLLWPSLLWQQRQLLYLRKLLTKPLFFPDVLICSVKSKL